MRHTGFERPVERINIHKSVHSLLDHISLFGEDVKYFFALLLFPDYLVPPASPSWGGNEKFIRIHIFIM